MDFQSQNGNTSIGKHGVQFTTFTQYQTWFGVHPDHVGFVIGGKGATVKKISRDCKCLIKIQDPNPFSGGISICANGHGAQFNTNGQHVSGPGGGSLKSYETEFTENILIVYGG